MDRLPHTQSNESRSFDSIKDGVFSESNFIRESRFVPPLDPYRDQSVSKAVARRTTAGSRVAARAAFEDVFNTVRDTCNRRFETGRRLLGTELSELFRVFERDFDGNVDSIAAFDGDRPATRTRPKGEAFERIRVHTSPFENDGVIWLWTTRLFATRKTAVLETVRSPFSWVQHAVARLFERDGGHSDANREIGEAIMLHNFMLSVATDLIAFEKLPRKMGIPCGAGLLLGEVQELRMPEGASRRYMYDRQYASVSTLFPQALNWRMPAGDVTASWRAMTYVGECEMKPNQVEFVARWNDLRAKFRASADLIVQIQPRMNAEIDRLEVVNFSIVNDIMLDFEEATNHMRRLLADPQMSFAVGNGFQPSIVAGAGGDERLPEMMPGL